MVSTLRAEDFHLRPDASFTWRTGCLYFFQYSLSILRSLWFIQFSFKLSLRLQISEPANSGPVARVLQEMDIEAVIQNLQLWLLRNFLS